jgi:glutathione-regulated potassium-efflux system ancillary protein KefC
LENNLLLVILLVLVASVALVPLAKASGLGTVLGFLAVGVLIGPFGLGIIADTETILHVSEFGVVMMLFLIGLELQPAELWRMRHRLLGLGVTQVVFTSAALCGLLVLFGYGWATSLVVGLALSLSSTAIAMQAIEERDITHSDTGRTSLSILLVQDVAVIPILAAVPLIASIGYLSPQAIGIEVTEVARALENPADWVTPLLILAVFGAALVGSRIIVRPALSWVARTGVREIFTALALALVVGGALVTQMTGLSPALGAFVGGVLLADSEYRHELQSILEPFKGLLLGLFFISVGMSIAFDVVMREPVHIAGLVLLLVLVKAAVLLAVTRFTRMHLADRLLAAVLLSQAGEFAFVVLQLGLSSNAIAQDDWQVLMATVALSMAVTPLLLLAFDRLVAPRLDARKAAPPTETIDRRQRIVVLGYGRFGQIVTRMLRAQGFEMTLIDDDPAQIELMRRFGIKVFYGDGSRLDLLHAARVRDAQLVVIAASGGHRILSIARLVRSHFPHVAIAARATDREHVYALRELGVEAFERETFLSAISLGQQALVALGYEPDHAERLGQAFERHDRQLLEEAYEIRNDSEAYVGLFRRKSMELLDELMKADVKPEVDKSPPERSE